MRRKERVIDLPATSGLLATAAVSASLSASLPVSEGSGGPLGRSVDACSPSPGAASVMGSLFFKTTTEVGRRREAKERGFSCLWFSLAARKSTQLFWH